MTDESQIEPAKGSEHQPETDTPAEASAGRKQLSPRTKGILLAIVVVVLLAVGIWFVRHLTYGRYFQETNDAQIQADAVQIAPRVSGYVSQVMVTDNEDVRAGQPLARIDVRSYQATADQARAAMAQADAAAQNAQAGVAEQQAAITQAEAALAAARVKAAHDAAEVARYIPLAASGAETRQQLAQLRLAAAQSAQDVAQQAAALEGQRRKIPGLQAQIKQAQAQGQGAKAQLSAAAVDVTASMLTAPVEGRIGDKTVEVGQFVQAGTRLLSVVPLNKLYIVANFKETQLALMRPGQPVNISVDALDGHDIKGHVESISPGTGAQFSILPPENATGNFTKIVQRVPVRIAIEMTPAAKRLLVPGLSVTVTVDTRNAKGDLDRMTAEQERVGQQGN